MENKIEEMANDIAEVRLGENKLKLSSYLNTNAINKIAEQLVEKGWNAKMQGEWKFYKVRSYGVSITHELVCNRCGIKVEMLQGRHYKYCPNCSAKMKGE